MNLIYNNIGTKTTRVYTEVLMNIRPRIGYNS